MCIQIENVSSNSTAEWCEDKEMLIFVSLLPPLAPPEQRRERSASVGTESINTSVSPHQATSSEFSFAQDGHGGEWH